ncbi:hypothetical protein ACFLZM_04120 [Thermodesulfobacteriota bacterium]
MKKWKMIAGVLLVFVLGVLAGSLGAGFYHKTLYSRFKKDSSARKSFILKKFTEELDLSENQQLSFKTAIDRLDAQMLRQRAEIKKIMDANHREMKKVLNSEQQHKFEAFIKKIRKRKFSRHK